MGHGTSDDAGVVRLRDDLAIVNTIDFFTPIVDDPYTYGAVSAANALSDVYAMGGVPRTALNVVCFPRKEISEDVLGEILRGGADKVAEAGALLIGGHTVEDDQIKYGLAVTGVVDPTRVVCNVGAREGDALVLTKPLGTGILTTALKRRTLSTRGYDAVVRSMAALNGTASEQMLRYDVHAATDVTGFGLLGHAWEMIGTGAVSFRLEADALPLLPDVEKLVREGHLTGGCRRNQQWLQGKVQVEDRVPEFLREVAVDPQTSGGLLIALPAHEADALVEALQGAGIQDARRIGAVEAAGSFAVTLT